MSQNVRCPYCNEFFPSQEELQAHRVEVLDKRKHKSKAKEYICVLFGFVRINGAWTREKK